MSNDTKRNTHSIGFQLNVVMFDEINFFINFNEFILILHWLIESIPDGFCSLFPMPDGFWRVPL